MTLSLPALAAPVHRRLAGLGGWRLSAWASLAGAVAASGQAPWNMWPLAIAGFAALWALFSISRTPRRAALTGLAGGTGYFLLALNWIVEPFLVDIGRHGWMAPFALVLLAAGLALFWAGAFAVARSLGGRGLHWCLALAAAELARSYVFTGFPWALVGHTLIPSPLVQMAAWTGPHGLSLAVLALACALWALTRPGQWRWAVPVLALGGAGLVTGVRLADLPPPGPDAPVVRLVQPNAPQHEKWDPDKAHVFFQRQIAYTAAPTASDAPRPAVVIWPETAVPVLLDYGQEVLSRVAEAADGVPVVLGIQRTEGLLIFNSAVRVDAGGAVGALYDKHHLVPFGEYMPMGELMARFGIHGLASSEGRGYSPGPGARLMDLPGIGPALPLICYEAVFPQDVAAAPVRPRLLMQLTNDAWFGQVSGPYQHLAQARLRAVEQGLPMVRSANTGVSAVIDPRGRIVTSLALGQAGFVDAPLPVALSPTPYARSGDLPWAIAIFGLLAVFGMLRLARIGTEAD